MSPSCGLWACGLAFHQNAPRGSAQEEIDDDEIPQKIEASDDDEAALEVEGEMEAEEAKQIEIEP